MMRFQSYYLFDNSWREGPEFSEKTAFDASNKAADYFRNNHDGITSIKIVEIRPLKCQHCGREWEYKGTRNVKATCPDCGKQTPIDNGHNGKQVNKQI